MQDNIEIGERIRKVRGQYHMSREKFSEMIDISTVFLGQIERGERSLTIKTLNKLVDFTGFSSDYILYGSDKNNSYISKINKLLNRCSDETLEYIYNLIHSTFCFLRKKPNFRDGAKNYACIIFCSVPKIRLFYLIYLS